ncbi:MAG: FHA domain-containing protein [Chloroflexota bacterium]
MSRLTSRISITYMSGPLDGKTLNWDRPTADNTLQLTIGRREGCDISLNYDSQVSRLHARVVYEAALRTFYLEDMGSRNGTYLRGSRLEGRTSLRPGELFRIGRTWLRVDPARSTPEEADEDNTQF